MSKVKPLLSILKKLAAEGKAAKPLVKGSQKGGALMGEGQLAEGQKVIQELTSGEDYAKRMGLKRAAGIAGAMGASSLISQEDAKAAGIATIVKKLGVTEAVAKQIKKLAKTTKSAGEFEERINAIKSVRKYVKDPKQYEKLGSGADMNVYDVEGKAVKDPIDRMWRETYVEDDLKQATYPAIMEEAGLGPKTTSVATGKKQYQVQDKSKPLMGIEYETLPEYKALEKESDALYNSELPDQQYRVFKEDIELRKAQIRLKAIKDSGYKDAEQYQPENWRDYFPSGNIAEDFQRQARDKLKGKVDVRDLHDANVGLNPKGELEGFDTSRFQDPQYDKFTPEMKRKTLERYVGPKENKEMLESFFEGQAPKPMNKPAAPETPAWMKTGARERLTSPTEQSNKLKKVAAAAAGAAVLGAPTEEAEAGVGTGLTRMGLDKVIAKIMKASGGATYDNVLRTVEQEAKGNPRLMRRYLDELYGHSLMNEMNIPEEKHIIDQLLKAQDAIHPVPESQIGLHRSYPNAEPYAKSNAERYAFDYPGSGMNQNIAGAYVVEGPKNPKMAQTGELVYNLDTMQHLSPEDASALVGHETKHLTEGNVIARGYDFSHLDNPKLTPKEVIEKSMGGHYKEYPESYMEAEDLSKLLSGTYVNPQKNVPVIRNTIDEQMSQANKDILHKKYERQVSPGDVSQRASTYQQELADSYGKVLEKSDEQLLRQPIVDDLTKYIDEYKNLSKPALAKKVRKYFERNRDSAQNIVNRINEKRKSLLTKEAPLPAEEAMSILPYDRIKETKKFTHPFPKRESYKKAAAVAPAMGIDPTSSEFITKPLKEVANAYKTLVNKPARKLGEAVAQGLDMSEYASNPQARAALEKATQTGKDILGTGFEMALDPFNWASPGAGLAVPLAVEAFADEDDE